MITQCFHHLEYKVSCIYEINSLILKTEMNVNQTLVKMGELVWMETIHGRVIALKDFTEKLVE